MTQHDTSDGLSQLTEMMRDERVIENTHSEPPIDPQIRRQRRRRRLIVSGIATAIVLALVGSYVGYTLTAPLGAAATTSQVPEVVAPAAATLALSPEGASAVSVSGVDEYLGAEASGIWAASGGDDARPMASISKLITAMVVLSAKPLASADDPGPTLTFDKADNDLYDKYYVMGATIASMPIGSSMSENDALKMILVPSASNYAEAVVGWAFGSQGAFVSAANAWLAANGLTHTTMVEPTGIDARNTSTPSDLIALAKLATADPIVAQMVATPHVTAPNGEVMYNTNSLLGSDGVTGLKTGTLDATGSNLLFSASLTVGTGQPITVLGVVLGGASRDSVNLDVKALLASITAGFHDVPLAEQGQEVGTYSTAWGESARMVLGESASVLTWSDTPITATIETTTLTTGADGEEVGSVTWTAGPNTVTVPIVLEGTITPPTAWWRLTHPFELGE